jgi:hypothetical protein
MLENILYDRCDGIPAVCCIYQLVNIESGTWHGLSVWNARRVVDCVTTPDDKSRSNFEIHATD